MNGAWGVDSTQKIAIVWESGTEPSGDDGDSLTLGSGTDAISLTLRLPPANYFASQRDVGRRFDGTLPAGPVIPQYEQVNDAARGFFNRLLFHHQDLYRYDETTQRVGNDYLGSAFQTGKIILADSTTYPHALAIAIYRNGELGATDITNADQFADSSYSQAGAPPLTRALLWINKLTGARTTLENVQDYGPLVDERPFTFPTVWRIA